MPPLSTTDKSVIKQNQLSLAKDAYERVLSTTPDHSKVLQHLGGIYLRENTPFHNPQKCIDYISQSLEHGEELLLRFLEHR
jgi:glucose repression mediator protein